MTAAIAHRGPDAAGHWIATEDGVALGHRRLAIVDLTPSGAQPMHSHDGELVITFNGEIYNFPEIRDELARNGVTIKSTGDTEVLIEAISLWGVAPTCRRLSGMFAFAVWNMATKTLTLARDRFGKKPLYFSTDEASTSFSSELKSLATSDKFDRTLSEEAIADFFQFGYVSEHHCIFKKARKVKPAEIVTISPDGSLTSETYWSLQANISPTRRFNIIDLPEAKSELIRILSKATKQRMAADVPLGAFLSGGIDSGLVVSLMQQQAVRPTRTFSIGFETASHDEAPVAKAVARHLNTDHTELYISERAAQDVVPEMADIFDEPFADSSQIPTTLLAKLARQHVTVALTGDGGDEAFGGYHRYRSSTGMAGLLFQLPAPMRSGLSHGLSSIPSTAWERLASVIPSNKRPRFLASKVSKLARSLRIDDAAERGKQFLTIWNPSDILQESFLSNLRSRHSEVSHQFAAASEAMQFWESTHYLPGDLLVKMDRASMHSSLEARSPLLDHNVVEFAWQLDPELKAGKRALKYILRQALFDFVPPSLVDLPKQGFSVPIGLWLRTSLRPFTEEMLAYCARDLGHIVRNEPIQAAWQALLRGEATQADKVWSVLMFALWYRRWSPTS